MRDSRDFRDSRDSRDSKDSRDSREPRDREDSSGRPKQLFKRRKTCPFSEPRAPKIDYKDVRLLQRYTTERGRLIPSRISFVSCKHQRALATAIKRARFLALMPYVVK
ncbi:MAG: 30S ribosomal protein S18 [Alphaproteobacteria bacterium]|nr:30S ribosomal protein S18 [Alphaproteobacteria bacterium]